MTSPTGPMPAPSTPSSPAPLHPATRPGPLGLPRAYWALWSAVLVNRVATFVYPFLVLYLTSERGLTLVQAGAVATTMGTGAVAGGVLGGWSADHVGRRPTILAGYAASALTLLALAAARGLPAIVVAAFAAGAAAELARPGASALTADLVPEELRVRAYSLTFWALNLGFSVATFSAGWLSAWGWSTLFVIDAATNLVAGALLWRMLPPDRGRARPETGAIGLVRLVGSSPALRVLTLAGVGYAVVYHQAYASLPLALRADGLDAAAYGSVIAVNGLVIVLLQPFATRLLERRPPARVYAVSLVVVGAGFALTALADTAAAHVGAVVTWSVGEVMAASVGSALFAACAPAHLRGRVMALFGATFSVGAVVGPLLGTSVLERLGQGWLWGGCLVVLAALAPLVARGADPRWARTLEG